MFVLRDNGELIEMQGQAYDSESLLQDLLARYPNLLAGDQIDSLAPRRWLLISREMGLPSDEGGANRWAVDHLFLDQDAIPTIAEVKRSTDTRIRREVVGQMLGALANVESETRKPSSRRSARVKVPVRRTLPAVSCNGHGHVSSASGGARVSKMDHSTLTKRPTFPLAVLQRAGALEQFLTILDWMLQEYGRAWPEFKVADEVP